MEIIPEYNPKIGKTYTLPIQPVPITVYVDKQLFYLSFPFHETTKDEVKACLEGARWDKDTRQWVCRNSSRNWYVLRHVWMNSPQFRRYYEKPPEVTSRFPLWPNQKQALAAAIHYKRFFYAGKQGTGKMLIAFAAAEKWQEVFNDSNLWWVTSDSGMKAWFQEEKHWKPRFDVNNFVTYAGLAKAIEQAQRPPSRVIFDECAVYKTPSTIQMQAGLSLVELMEAAYGDRMYVLALNGTPEPLALDDWWGQCEVVRPGFVREGSIHKFRERYGVVKEFTVSAKEAADVHADVQEGRKVRTYKKVVAWKRGQTIDQEVVNPQNGLVTVQSVTLPDEASKLMKRFAGLVMRHDERDLPIDIHAKTYEVVKITPTKSMLAVAKHIANTEINVLTVLNKTRQLTDGFLYDDTTKQAKWGTSLKDGPLLERIKDKQRTIIFAAYTASIDHICQLLTRNGWEVIRVDGRGHLGVSVSDFQDTLDHNYKLAYVAHARSGGEAVTLTASDNVHFYSNGYNYKDRAQAELRVRYRKATIYDYEVLPVDAAVRANLMRKEDASRMSLDALRALYTADIAPLDGAELVASMLSEDIE